MITIIAGVLCAFASDVVAETTNNDVDIDTLQQEIQDLDQKVRILERKRELDQEAANASAKSVPQISLGTGGFNLTSADTNFSISLHGYIQLDSRTFLQNAAAGADGFILRRVRPIISGTVFHDFDFLIMPEFGGSSPSIYDAYVNYHPWPELQLQAGRFKSPIGLERLQSAKYLSFNERSLVTDLVPNRDLGVELHGDLLDSRVSYAAGIFNGVADEANTGNSDVDNDKEFAGRLFLEPLNGTDIAPLQGLGFGVGGSYGNEYGSGDLTSGYTTDGQQKFFTYTGTVANGPHWRISPQAYYYWGPFGLSGEYAISDQQVKLSAAPSTAADLQNTAWEVSAGWALTGEDASYNGVKPRHPFSLQKGCGWGAWELVGRYAELNVDDAAFPTFANPATSASAAHAWSVGLNWWLNKNVAVLASFSRTTFTSGASGSVTKEPEEVFFTRIQLAF
ncbi:MAG TPA: porin [Candidatus Saccharimonadales bacterium]|nr:porin [Candidatus Saccharimonadales bacterium]